MAGSTASEIEERTNLRPYTREMLEALMTDLGYRSFHGRQLHEWIWRKGLDDFSHATNLPASLRDLLSSEYKIERASVEEVVKSADGTIKVLFNMAGGTAVEGVLIPSSARVTACISSQAGCPLGCTFCATGLAGFSRNLNFCEIYDQAWLLNSMAIEQFGRNISNIVLMGMGEPLLNPDAVIEAVKMISDSSGMSMSPGRITVSTVGIPEGIITIAEKLPEVVLALSLHTVDERIRSELMPVNKIYPLKDVSQALQRYHSITGNRISIEYLLLYRLNDNKDDALALAAWCRSFPVKVNLIPYNPTGKKYRNSESAEIFKEILEGKNMVVTIRRSRGGDIDAACGQLASKRS